MRGPRLSSTFWHSDGQNRVADQREAPQRPSVFHSKKGFFAALADSPCFHSHSVWSGFRSGASWSSSSSERVLPSQCRTERLRFQLRPFRRDLAVTRTRRWVQKPFNLKLLPYAACWDAGAGRLLRSGSYTSPHTHNRCSSTANFLATPTIARFLAFLPPRWASFSPQRLRSVSGPRRFRIKCAPCTSNVRRYRSPSLVMRGCGWLCPDSLCLGRRPT